MIIKFDGNTSQSGYYRIGVIQNNLSDDLVLELSAMQGDIDLMAYRPFVKIWATNAPYTDKDGNLEMTPTDDGKLRLRYRITRTVSQFHSVDMQLQFEDYSVEGIAVFQTTIFNVAFNASIPADETIAIKEPTILQDHERRMQAIEQMPTSGVLPFTSKDDFPAIGKEAVVYVDESAQTLYCFDGKNNYYYIVGSDYQKIKIINCNGGI